VKSVLLVGCIVTWAALAGLPEVKSESNPDRRARLALENADTALTTARDAYKRQDSAATVAGLKELEDSVELARLSLEETGRDPRRRPKAFKFGENRTRELIRRLDSLENDMDLDDRKLLDGAKAKLREVNEEWLLGIMNGHKRGGK